MSAHQGMIDRITALDTEYKDLYCPHCEVELRNLFHFSCQKKRLADLWLSKVHEIPDQHEDHYVSTRISLLKRRMALLEDIQASRKLLWGGVYVLFGCAAFSTYLAVANPFSNHQWSYIAPPVK